ncbi:MAG: hypothetical protein ACNA8P_06580, partial [Phycisphaerales bacterium]
MLSNFDLETNVFNPVDIAVEFIPDGTGDYDQVLRMRGGMPIPGGGGFIAPAYAPFESTYDLNNHNDIVFAAAVNLPDPPATAAILVNGAIVRQSGDINSFADGFLTIDSGQAAINDSLEYAYFGF